MDAGTAAGTEDEPAPETLPTDTAAVPSTGRPHFAQNFVPGSEGIPHPTQNFFPGSAAATHFVPHEEQNVCVSASDAPQALHVLAIFSPFRGVRPHRNSPPHHFFVTVPS